MNSLKFSALLVMCLAVGYSTQDPIPINWLVETIAAGVTLKLGDTKIAVGAVTVPLDFLCGDFPNLPEVCRLCDIDCIKTHNATGGKCTTLSPTQSSCICDYSGTRTDPGCGHYTPALLPPSSVVDGVVDSVIAGFLRGRYSTIICGPVDGAGTCNVECQNNHAAKSGTCDGYNPSNPLVQGFCTCHY